MPGGVAESPMWITARTDRPSARVAFAKCANALTAGRRGNVCNVVAARITNMAANLNS